jgi:hypothetical protein
VPFSPTLGSQRSGDQPGDGQHPAGVPTENIATWLLPTDPPADYPEPIVDHAVERREALNRYAAIKRG